MTTAGPECNRVTGIQAEPLVICNHRVSLAAVVRAEVLVVLMEMDVAVVFCVCACM